MALLGNSRSRRPLSTLGPTTRFPGKTLNGSPGSGHSTPCPTRSAFSTFQPLHEGSFNEFFKRHFNEGRRSSFYEEAYQHWSSYQQKSGASDYRSKSQGGRAQEKPVEDNSIFFGRAPPPLAKCYSALGLSPRATLDAVKSAFDQIAKASHPDAGGKDVEKFIIAKVAYDAIRDSKTR